MNITLDDTSPSLAYSSGWRRQPANDENYFLNTYHASQTKGETMTFTFGGTAIYIYGSRGPNHGNYSVQFDDFVQFFPGFSNDQEYQSLLFTRKFDSGTHDILLTNQENFWLDVDFIVLTTDSTVSSTAPDPGAFPTTVSPLTPPTLDPTGSSSNPGASQPASSAPTHSASLFLVLTIVLASILGIIVFLLIAFCWWKRRKDFTNARELSFRYGHKGVPTAPTFSQAESTTASGNPRLSTFGNALLGIMPGSRGTPSPSGRSVPVSARYQEKRMGGSGVDENISVAGSRGEGEDLIALSNFGQRPKFPGDNRSRSDYGRGRSNSETITERSETPSATSWKTGGTMTATGALSPGSATGWASEKEPLRGGSALASPMTANSNMSDSQLSQWTAKQGQARVAAAPTRANAIGVPIMLSDTSARSLPTPPSLTGAQIIAQRQQETRSFSPARSEATSYSASEAAIYASRHRNNSSGSGGYAHAAAANTGLSPPPRTERDRDRDRERDRLERIEREERERQERLASARYDRVGAGRYTNRPPPSYNSIPQPQIGNSRLGDIPIGLSSALPTDFDRDLEVRRAGSPVDSARGTGSLRMQHTPTPDLNGGSTRSYTPDQYSNSIRQ